MNKQKATYFLQDLEAYKSGEIDEIAMIENIKYFLNEESTELQVSNEVYDELLATYGSLEALITYCEELALNLISGSTETEETEEEV